MILADGKYMALDLGGTNFRVILIELDGEKIHMDVNKILCFLINIIFYLIYNSILSYDNIFFIDMHKIVFY
jgi:hypothetical protein